MLAPASLIAFADEMSVPPLCARPSTMMQWRTTGMPNISANISESDLHEVVDDDAVAAARVALLDGHTPLVADAHLAMAPWLRCVTMPRRWHGFVV